MGSDSGGRVMFATCGYGAASPRVKLYRLSNCQRLSLTFDICVIFASISSDDGNSYWLSLWLLFLLCCRCRYPTKPQIKHGRSPWPKTASESLRNLRNQCFRHKLRWAILFLITVLYRRALLQDKWNSYDSELMYVFFFVGQLMWELRKNGFPFSLYYQTT